MVDDPCMFTNVDNKSCALISSIFSSPDPKGHVSFCHHFASVVSSIIVVRVCKLFIFSDLDQTWQKCSLGGPLPDVLFLCRSEI